MERTEDGGRIRGSVKGAPLVAVVAVLQILLVGELGRHDRHRCVLLLPVERIDHHEETVSEISFREFVFFLGVKEMHASVLSAGVESFAKRSAKEVLLSSRSKRTTENTRCAAVKGRVS